MILPEELLVKLERAMNEISYGEAKISWAEKGSFIEMQIVEKLRVEKPEEYPRG